MDEQKEIVNRVASSTLVTFDLENYYQVGERVEIDIKDRLYEGLILKESDFRSFIAEHEWSVYKDKFVAVHCSVDAIIPTWAFMLVGIALAPYARKVVFGTKEDLDRTLFQESLAKIDWSVYAGAKVVIKGCSGVEVPVSAYVEAVARLTPVAASLMYGEPCSTVPLYKKPKHS